MAWYVIPLDESAAAPLIYIALNGVEMSVTAGVPFEATAEQLQVLLESNYFDELHPTDPPPGSAPVELVGGMTLFQIVGTVGAEKLGEGSFRACFATDNSARGYINLTGLEAGTYRVAGDLSAYDGAKPVVALQCAISDNGAPLQTHTTAGAKTGDYAVSSGILRLSPTSSRGFRVDNLSILKVG